MTEECITNAVPWGDYAGHDRVMADDIVGILCYQNGPSVMVDRSIKATRQNQTCLCFDNRFAVMVPLKPRQIIVRFYEALKLDDKAYIKAAADAVRAAHRGGKFNNAYYLTKGRIYVPIGLKLGTGGQCLYNYSRLKAHDRKHHNLILGGLVVTHTTRNDHVKTKQQDTACIAQWFEAFKAQMGL